MQVKDMKTPVGRLACVRVHVCVCASLRGGMCRYVCAEDLNPTYCARACECVSDISLSSVCVCVLQVGYKAWVAKRGENRPGYRTGTDPTGTNLAFDMVQIRPGFDFFVAG